MTGGPENLRKLQDKVIKSNRWLKKFYDLTTNKAPKYSKLLEVIHGKNASPEDQLRNDSSFQEGPLEDLLREEVKISQQDLSAHSSKLTLARLSDPEASRTAAVQSCHHPCLCLFWSVVWLSHHKTFAISTNTSHIIPV